MKNSIFFTIFVFFVVISDSFANSTVYMRGFADVVEPLMPAVVNISTTKKEKRLKPRIHEHFSDGHMSEIFEHFGFPFNMDEIPFEPHVKSLGSGFVIDSSGYIVTNYHVVHDISEALVKFHDGTELKAKIVGLDSKTDIALLKVDSKKPLAFVNLGDSSSARTGDFVIVIGNPFGLGGTVTTGIVSSKSRDISNEFDSVVVDDYIQTDAAINPGNSGGPIFNMDGEVIGVSTCMIGVSNSGLGFGVPSSTVTKIVEQLKMHGKVQRTVLGVVMQKITPEIAEGLGIAQDAGVLVVDVVKDSVADKAGIKTNDIIVEFDNKPVKDMRKLKVIISQIALNSNVSAKIIRAGKSVNVNLVMTDSDSKPLTSGAKEYELNGVIFGNLTAALVEQNNLESANGIVVKGYSDNAKLKWRNLLLIGDIIISANQEDIKNIDDLKNVYQTSERSNIVFLIKRKNMTLFIPLPIIK